MRPRIVEAINEQWREQAACRGYDPNTFFPDGDDPAAIAVAKFICSNCTVREDCANHALQTREKHGVWGGITEQERRRILRHKLPWNEF